MEMPARGERSLPVLSYIHRAPHCVALDHPFEYVADTGSLILMVAAAAQAGPFDLAADIAREKLAAMAAHQLIAFLFEEKRVDRVVPLIGDLDVPLPVEDESAADHDRVGIGPHPDQMVLGDVGEHLPRGGPWAAGFARRGGFDSSA